MITVYCCLDVTCENNVKHYMDGDVDSPAIETHIVGRSRALCVKAARANGWILNMKKGKAYCPKCSGKLPKA